jgi:hypothetical protein
MFRKKIALPVPLDRWFKDIKSVEELREILESDSFQTAVAILKEISGPTHATLADSDNNSLRLAWYAGYRDAFSDLSKLTKFPSTPTTSTTNTEWTHIVPNP